MSEAVDFIDDEDNDMLIKDGDLATGPSSDQHIEDILLSPEGDWKSDPLIGVGLMNYKNSPDSIAARRGLRKRIETQLLLDGFDINTLEVKGFDDITIDAIKEEE